MVKLQTSMAQTQRGHNRCNIAKQQIPCHMFIKQSIKFYIRPNTIVQFLFYEYWTIVFELHIMVPWSWYFGIHVAKVKISGMILALLTPSKSSCQAGNRGSLCLAR